MERSKHSGMVRTNKPVIIRTKEEIPLPEQMKRKVNAPIPEKRDFDGYFPGNNISTGSTLLDLAISGGRVRGGGLPGGILVEIFGPSGSGKTVLLSEIAGAVQRRGGDVMFHDPEARLNKQFAQMFDLDTNKMNYGTPDTVPEVFQAVRKWEPKKSKKDIINGIFADSLAALSTDMEMDSEDGDKMGMRRAKEFSEECRKTCRILTQKNFLMVCSNQVRQSLDTFGPKYKSPGGEAIGFYSSLRLRAFSPEKIKQKKKIAGKEVSRVIGVNVQVEVYKSSIWKPHHIAPVTILFDYGIDDIRQNLQFIKDHTTNTIYMLGTHPLSKSMEESIKMIEDTKREERLRQEVILLWNSIEHQFNSNRKTKKRYDIEY